MLDSKKMLLFSDNVTEEHSTIPDTYRAGGIAATIKVQMDQMFCSLTSLLIIPRTVASRCCLGSICAPPHMPGLCYHELFDDDCVRVSGVQRGWGRSESRRDDIERQLK